MCALASENTTETTVPELAKIVVLCASSWPFIAEYYLDCGDKEEITRTLRLRLVILP